MVPRPNTIPLSQYCLNTIPSHLNPIPLSQYHTIMSLYHTTTSHTILLYMSCYPLVHCATVSFPVVMTTCVSDLQDRGSSTINLLHPSSKKQLCDSFKVEDPAEFDQYIATSRGYHTHAFTGGLEGLFQYIVEHILFISAYLRYGTGLGAVTVTAV